MIEPSGMASRVRAWGMYVTNAVASRRGLSFFPERKVRSVSEKNPPHL